MKTYILKDKIPVLCEDLRIWSAWMSNANRHVAVAEKDGVKVSTVFLGLDHSFDGKSIILFETMIFGGEYDQYQDRCCTWGVAEKMHKTACDLVGIPSG